MFGKKPEDDDSDSSTAQVTIDSTEGTFINTTVEVEEPKKKRKSKKEKKAQPEPQLARDAEKQLNLVGKFYGGIASMKVDKTTLELHRTQRIIIEQNGVHYEYTRMKPPY